NGIRNGNIAIHLVRGINAAIVLEDITIILPFRDYLLIHTGGCLFGFRKPERPCPFTHDFSSILIWLKIASGLGGHGPSLTSGSSSAVDSLELGFGERYHCQIVGTIENNQSAIQGSLEHILGLRDHGPVIRSSVQLAVGMT